jgi:transposase-like protein
MSLDVVSDRYLAARAANGDGFAFAELARLYRRLIWSAAQFPPAGVGSEDLRQEALLGLLETCQRHDPAKGAFAALARLNVRQRVNRARFAAVARKHRVLSDAIADPPRDADEQTEEIVERIAAPEGTDPARVVELRDALREHARARARDGRRRYSDDQLTRALALIAGGKTIKETAFAVGATRDSVAKWVRRSGQPHAGRRRFTSDEINRAVALVQNGASVRQAGVAVGASKPAVLRWLREAA